ncbi:glycoside hydrolase family 9 protein [Cryptosporangium aurantiacum]|uniref:Endoglucanase n=1 Tax=Cryptosporangium aurantiacum TaxID=134849 RepID=A0A1M7I0T1_9ACTN|nr:glycoside hydrolase family 9 protein [Cryptosporangium aurantiacum]SHM34354.1 endoglucanase [Cryptosporangium aurantiacum]
MTVRAVRVNQLGYPAGWPLRATVATDATTPLRWHLRDATSGTAVAGETTVHGLDRAAGESVHTITVPTVAGEGDGWTLVVEGVESPPFAVGAHAAARYRDLAGDAARFLYLQRSGTTIDDAEYGRPAGHVDAPPNRGDSAVACRRPDCPRRRWLFGCRGHDLRGGWYDAGDHGKYAVTTAVSIWLLQHAEERTRSGDPALLDEARWGLEFLFAAQLPTGDPQAGMVFHAVHDVRWTGLPLRPDQDPEPRTVRAPSTAATYGLAAVAAQAARVWEVHDPVFAARCTTAADRAWTAASSLPVVYADVAEGGGPYDDTDVRDERYWAAAELAVLTGAEEYRYAMVHSGLDPLAALREGFDWRSVLPLAQLTLALGTGWVAASAATAARAALAAAAETLLATIDAEGHGTPYAPPDGRYCWGSNSRVLAHALTLGAAADHTGDRRYFAGELACLDHLLGRNASGVSQVTGYGVRAASRPHHRFFAHSVDPSYPQPPPGVVVGGPNSGLDDPVAAAALSTAPPQRCWIDDVGSWATNEVTIGWNAALTVVARHVAARVAPARSLDIGRAA